MTLRFCSRLQGPMIIGWLVKLMHALVEQLVPFDATLYGVYCVRRI